MTVHPAVLANGRLGRPYQRKVAASPAGSYTYGISSGNLPSGLTLSPNGILSGTPTANGTFSFRVTATGFNSCTGTGTYTVTIGPN